jgi:hypothetical protein
MSPRWLRRARWVLGGWSDAFRWATARPDPAAGSGNPRLGFGGRVQRPGPGGAALEGVSVAPPPVEAAARGHHRFREHHERPVDAGLPPLDRQRVMLLPHAQIEPLAPDPQPPAQEGP